jgi:hypothetical protein
MANILTPLQRWLPTYCTRFDFIACIYAACYSGAARSAGNVSILTRRDMKKGLRVLLSP